jgi:hypothetical protein
LRIRPRHWRLLAAATPRRKASVLQRKDLGQDPHERFDAPRDEPEGLRERKGTEGLSMQRRIEDLLETLLTEMAQTERSAREHPRKEANRLGVDAPPARALLAVTDHAERRLPEIERLAGSSRSSVGETIGNKLSLLR